MESTSFLFFAISFAGNISGPEIICGPIWGSFAVPGSFQGLHISETRREKDDKKTTNNLYNNNNNSMFNFTRQEHMVRVSRD